MGRWNRRYYTPRRKNYKYQDPQWSPPRETYTDPEFGVWHDNVPLWEKKFCYYVGSVPWEKVLGAKTFMHCFNDVLEWDDSAGEEAFCNAKQRYWAKINGLPCDIELPDPDSYVDSVDWNAEIDPELIRDLESEYIAPDENDGWVVNKTKRSSMRFSDCNAENHSDLMRHLDSEYYAPDSNVGAAEDNTNRTKFVCGPGLSGNDPLPSDNNNPWEHSKQADRMQSESNNPWNEHVTPIEKSNGWNDPWEQNNINHPWEPTRSSASKAVKDNTWGSETRWKLHDNSDMLQSLVVGNSWKCGNAESRRWQENELSSWVQKPHNYDNSKNWSSDSNPWEHGHSGGRRWQDDSKRRSSSSSKPAYRNNYKPQQNCFRKNNGALKDAGNSWVQKEWAKHGGKANGYPEASGGCREPNGGCRKREGSDHYMTGYKGPRIQGPDHQPGRYWRKK